MIDQFGKSNFINFFLFSLLNCSAAGSANTAYSGRVDSKNRSLKKLTNSLNKTTIYTYEFCKINIRYCRRYMQIFRKPLADFLVSAKQFVNHCSNLVPENFKWLPIMSILHQMQWYKPLRITSTHNTVVRKFKLQINVLPYGKVTFLPPPPNC